VTGMQAQLVDPRTTETFDVLGPTVEFLTPPDETGGAPCLMRGTIPPGVPVALHSHPEPETFLGVSGEVEALVHSGEGFDWVTIGPGDVFHVPGSVRHAFRNRRQEPAVMMIVTTTRIGRFFRKVGTRVPLGTRTAGPPSGEAIGRFLEVAERYGYWNAGPEENAEIGIALTTPSP
jgi:quercetin dioxygenase-like cupin family protein